MVRTAFAFRSATIQFSTEKCVTYIHTYIQTYICAFYMQLSYIHTCIYVCTYMFTYVCMCVIVCCRRGSQCRSARETNSNTQCFRRRRRYCWRHCRRRRRLRRHAAFKLTKPPENCLQSQHVSLIGLSRSTSVWCWTCAVISALEGNLLGNEQENNKIATLLVLLLLLRKSKKAAQLAFLIM